MTPPTKTYDINDLIKLMSDLRDPNNGCPWDLEQNFASIAPHTLEEAYEVVDAIDRMDMKDLREELGDLLFQSVYHAQLASEGSHFTLHDVIHDITAKMISRHAHVFGEEKANNAEDVSAIWETRKNAEKHGENLNISALDGVTASLPSLLKAQKIQDKAAKVGFEWPDIHHVLDKMEEEIQELREAVKNRDTNAQSEELGDILFVLVNYGRMLGINSEEALRQCNAKFERRFKGLERDLKKRGIDLAKTTLEQMEDGWNEQKLKEKC